MMPCWLLRTLTVEMDMHWALLPPGCLPNLGIVSQSDWASVRDQPSSLGNRTLSLREAWLEPHRLLVQNGFIQIWKVLRDFFHNSGYQWWVPGGYQEKMTDCQAWSSVG